MFAIDDVEFLTFQYNHYFIYTLWFIAALFLCDWCTFVLNHLVLPYSLMPSLLLSLYVIHIDVFMWTGASRFERRFFLVKTISLLVFHTYRLQQIMNRINVFFAFYTAGYVLFVLYTMNFMEAEYRCKTYYDSPHCPTGSHLSILLGMALK